MWILVGSRYVADLQIVSSNSGGVFVPKHPFPKKIGPAPVFAPLTNHTSVKQFFWNESQNNCEPHHS